MNKTLIVIHTGSGDDIWEKRFFYQKKIIEEECHLFPLSHT